MFLCLPACLESCCFTFSNIIIWLRADSHVEIACSTRKAITCQSAWGDHHSPAPATGDIEGGPGHEITWIGHKEWLCHAQAGTKEHQPRASTQSFSSKCRKRRKKNKWISPIRRTLPTIVFFSLCSSFYLIVFAWLYFWCCCLFDCNRITHANSYETTAKQTQQPRSKLERQVAQNIEEKEYKGRDNNDPDRQRHWHDRHSIARRGVECWVLHFARALHYCCLFMWTWFLVIHSSICFISVSIYVSQSFLNTA